MELRRVLEGVPVISNVLAGLLDAEVRGLAYDSRKVESGYLFFAFTGAKADGAQFANAALQKGALGVVSDRPSPGGFSGTWLRVEHGRQALASASRNFYERPDQRLALTAVTGTNGKTTSTYPDRLDAARGRQDDRTDRHHRISPGGTRAAGREYDTRIARPVPRCSTSWSKWAERMRRSKRLSHAWTSAASTRWNFIQRDLRTSRATIWIITTRWKRISPQNSCYSNRATDVLRGSRF